MGAKAPEENGRMAHIQMDGSALPDKMPLPPVNTPLAFQVVNIEEKEAKSGKPMLELTLEFQDDSCPDNVGDKFFDYFVEPATNKKTQIALNNFVKAVTGAPIPPTGLDTEELIGKKGKFVLKAEQYQGEERRRIQGYVR
jgi:hypothetical protein